MKETENELIEQPEHSLEEYFSNTVGRDVKPGDIPLEYFRNLTLMDDVLFSQVASHPEAMEEILQTILQKDDLKVERVEPQKNLRNIDHRSVTLDAYCELKDGSRVNVEVQKKNDDDMQRRMRYNLSNIDTTLAKSGSDFANLPDVYLILISDFDLFAQGRTIYHVRRTVEGIAGKDYEVYNGVKEIYVNTAVKSTDKIGQLMEYFKHTTPENSLFPKLAKRVQENLLTEEGLQHMSNLSNILYENGMRKGLEEGEAKGEKKGEKKTLAFSILNLMETLGLSFENAAKALKIPEEEWNSYREAIKVAV